MQRDFKELAGRDGYHHRSHNKTKLMVHLVLVTKYRKKLLTGDMDTDVKQILFDTARQHHWYIRRMESDVDHIHILLQYPPTDSVKHIVSILKQRSTYYIWKIHAGKLASCYWKEHTFWSDGYFAASTGDASSETIARYIENQG